MHNPIFSILDEEPVPAGTLHAQETMGGYDAAEQLFRGLMAIEDLDRNLQSNADAVEQFEKYLNDALAAAFRGKKGDPKAHLFLQRILYLVNRMTLFWYDDLRRYCNEDSYYLRLIRDRVEEFWQSWELEQLDRERIHESDVRRALLNRSMLDLAPEPTSAGRYFMEEATVTGYRRLLAIASLDGLVEASQLSRMLGGPGNRISAVLTRLVVEEYGFGRLNKKHSSFFESMLDELDMSTEPETYFDLVPWEVLAVINHSFYLSERKRHFLRYIGGLLQIEVSTPASYIPYRSAAERLGLSPRAREYWDLHIKVDETYGRWMLNQVAIPLVERYPDDAWEIVLGYDQQHFMSLRSSDAIERSARHAESTGAAV